MPLYLSEIVAKKRIRLEEKNLSIDELKKIIKMLPARPSFYEALNRDGLSIIGEIKKASPSKGLIKENFNAVAIGKEYESCVDCISVLAEEDYFLGSDYYLKDVSAAVSLPTLCKDFIFDPIQIYNAKALGASCILLIVNILSDTLLKDLLELAHSIGLDVLVETHTKTEIESAVKAGAKIIGVNNRDLATFKTSIEVTLELAKYVPQECILVSESGILSPKDVEVLAYADIDAILVGENFMKSDNIAKTAEELKSAYSLALSRRS
jgi:indole-3-glycerol phosphate synthase